MIRTAAIYGRRPLHVGDVEARVLRSRRNEVIRTYVRCTACGLDVSCAARTFRLELIQPGGGERGVGDAIAGGRTSPTAAETKQTYLPPVYSWIARPQRFW